MAIPLFIGIDDFVVDFAFTIAAVVFCFLIYYRTREIYRLSKYEGIKYFRESFLFFGFSYAMRFLFGLVLLSRIVFGIKLPREVFAPILILPLGYFSTMGIFYLLYSALRNKLSGKNWLYIGHGLAILLSAVSFATRSHIILLLLQSILLAAVLVIVFASKGRKKVSKTRILYFLISILWLMNLWVAGLRRPFFSEIRVIFDLLSLAVFFTIYHKISKWIR